MLVNILLSVYNGEKYLKEQLESLRSQTYPHIHLYIRDDGSSDASHSIIQDFSASSPFPVTFIQGENLGFVKSFFQLLSKSPTGDLWSFCDQDDVWLPDKVERGVNWMKTQPTQIPLLFQTAYVIVDQDLNPTSNYLPPKYSIDFRRSITENWYSGFSSMINGSLREFLLLGNPEKIDYHDWWMEMIAAAFGKMEFDSHICAKYRRSNHSVTRITFQKKIQWFLANLKLTSPITLRCQEFQTIFQEKMQEKDRQILAWFCLPLSLKNQFRKVFFPKAWRPDLPSELSMRLLMLFGKL